MIKLVLHALFLLGIFSTHHANAQQPAAKNLSLNGLAVHAQLRNDIYIAAVYTEVGAGNAQMLLESDQDKRMELRVLADRWSARSFAAHWNQTLLINNNEQQLANFEREVRQFTSAIRGKLIPGDKITIDYHVKQYTQLAVDGVPLLTVTKDPLQFFQLLLRGWIGPRPPSSEFKSNILNLPTDANAAGLLARYDALLPVSGRNKTIMAWRAGNSQAAALATVSRPAPTTKANARPAPTPAPMTPIPTAPSPTPAPSNAMQEARVAAVPGTPNTADTAMLAPEKATADDPPADAAGLDAVLIDSAAQNASSNSTPEHTSAPAKQPVVDQPIEETAREKRENGLLNLYKSNLLKRVYGFVIYPARAINRNQEGTVVLQVTVNRKGKVLKIKNDEPSRYRLLNSAATKAIKKASPFPAAPNKLQGSTFDLEFPIVFRIPQS